MSNDAIDINGVKYYPEQREPRKFYPNILHNHPCTTRGPNHPVIIMKENLKEGTVSVQFGDDEPLVFPYGVWRMIAHRINVLVGNKADNWHEIMHQDPWRELPDR